MNQVGGHLGKNECGAGGLNPGGVASSSLFLRWELASVLTLLATVFFLWCAAWGMWTARDWSYPTAYLETRESDILGMLASFRAAADGHGTPLLIKRIPELGAPGEAVWSDMPIVEEIPYWLTGLLARMTGLFAATNIKVLLGHLLAALSFYLVARYFSCSRAWAFLGGIAFGTAPFIFSETPHHSVVAWVWHIPLFLVVWELLVRERAFTKRNYFFCLGVGFLTGLLNVYYTNIFCQIVLLSAVGASWAYRSWQPLIRGGAVILSAAAAFFLMALDTILTRLSYGANQDALERPYRWLEVYGLKFVDLLIPHPDHQLEFFREISRNYSQQSILVNEGAYIGLLGIASLFFLFGFTIYLMLRRPPGKIPAPAWQTAWIFFAFTIGGLNSLVGIFGLTMFRAGYRSSIVILAIVLMFAIRKLSTWLPEGHRLGLLIPVALALVVVWDHLPLTPTPAQKHSIQFAVNSDREFVRKIENQLPGGAMIFQLPPQSFPESPIPGMTPYEHLRPYIFSESLRFSFGAVRGREVNLPGLDDAESMGDFLQILRSHHFVGVLVNRKGYGEHSPPLERQILEAGGEFVAESALGDLVFYSIQPSANLD
jgi:phosphoglycerol transferase